MAERISLAHGEGGELTHRLIEDVFAPAFGHGGQTRFDAASLHGDLGRVAVTTDSYVIRPLFFPGGSIGKLAVTGTVNDLAVSGAVPKFLTAGFIIEEGFPLADLKRITADMAEEAQAAGVSIIAGDTKVVEKGGADGLFINTSGIGCFPQQRRIHPDAIKEGDVVIASGTIGDHGIAILGARQELGLMMAVESDCASLNHLIQELMKETDGIRLMRDPTRGGLATALTELCEDFRMTVELDESTVPIRNDVRGACDLLGFDPLYLANEGKVVLIADEKDCDRILEKIRQHERGKNACMIGRVTSSGDPNTGKLLLKTPIGTTRRLQRLAGMLLPRIC
ncbi:hydrogenase expression/formation protein HypE [Bacillus marinisedimentorum]|uniref:hydrogenase expression/formation protein HypE n=1 Tax=Bacillus marinisedimentorum TaxID=1821260 RepID=UPI000B138CD4|nr:hydrogenase expression/formation protein HypE [Bacillus marinisedimentorum]